MYDNQLHVLGGDNNGSPGFTHYVYDIATDSWNSAAPLLIWPLITPPPHPMENTFMSWAATPTIILGAAL
ncbi:MAG: hypothetical protein R3E31_06625 [Chloroflexota bacterium]